MATQAQINANRQNAERSTGPRTLEGKATISQNALKHGLFADETVINGENQADFDLHRDAYLAEMAPVGMTESMLAERIASLWWRLRRAERMQNQYFDEMIDSLQPSALEISARAILPKFLRQAEENATIPEARYALGSVARKDWANNRTLDRMMMYERRIESSMLRTMHHLKKLQIIRRVELEAVAEQPAADRRSAAERRRDLKNQTQFAPEIMGIKFFEQDGYDNNSRPDSAQNKANQSQFTGSPEGAGRRKRVRQALSGSEVAG